MEMYHGDPDTSIQEVADLLGYSREAVRRWLTHFDIPIKGRGRVAGKKLQCKQLLDREWLAEQLETKLQKQIAAELGVKDSVVNYWVRQHGLHNMDKGETIRDALRKRYPDGRVGDKHPRWRGGRWMTGAGYILAHCPDHPNASKTGYVFEHRLVMEEMLGRYLETDEIVHHIDGNKANNDPDNLAVMDKGQHISEHFAASHEVKRLRKRVKELEAIVREYERRYGRIKD